MLWYDKGSGLPYCSRFHATLTIYFQKRTYCGAHWVLLPLSSVLTPTFLLYFFLFSGHLSIDVVNSTSSFECLNELMSCNQGRNLILVVQVRGIFLSIGQYKYRNERFLEYLVIRVSRLQSDAHAKHCLKYTFVPSRRSSAGECLLRKQRNFGAKVSGSRTGARVCSEPKLPN